MFVHFVSGISSYFDELYSLYIKQVDDYNLLQLWSALELLDSGSNKNVFVFVSLSFIYNLTLKMLKLHVDNKMLLPPCIK